MDWRRPLGQRSRKRRSPDAPVAEAARPDPAAERMARGYARGRARDEAARTALKPLAPGERPLAVTLAAVLAAALGIGIVAIASPLFWFLIRAMARIQLPARRPHDPVG